MHIAGISFDRKLTNSVDRPLEDITASGTWSGTLPISNAQAWQPRSKAHRQRGHPARPQAASMHARHLFRNRSGHTCREHDFCKMPWKCGNHPAKPKDNASLSPAHRSSRSPALPLSILPPTSAFPCRPLRRAAVCRICEEPYPWECGRLHIRKAVLHPATEHRDTPSNSTPRPSYPKDPASARTRADAPSHNNGRPFQTAHSSPVCCNRHKGNGRRFPKFLPMCGRMCMTAEQAEMPPKTNLPTVHRTHAAGCRVLDNIGNGS